LIDTDGQFEDSHVEPCDQLLQVFFRIVTELHEYEEKNKLQGKPQEITEERKANKNEYNHDESVRLQQEPEVEEIEQKTSKDRPQNKESVLLPKIQEKYDEAKTSDKPISNMVEQFLPNNPNTQNQRFAGALQQMYQASPMKQQQIIDVDDSHDYPMQQHQSNERSYQERRVYQQNYLPSIPQQYIAAQRQVMPQQMMRVQSPITMNPYSRSVQSPNQMINTHSNIMQSTAMPSQYTYQGIPQRSYFPNIPSNYGMNRMGQQPVTLPSMNQLASLMSNSMSYNPMYSAQQSRMQGSPPIPMYMSHPQMGRQMPSQPNNNIGYNLSQLTQHQINQMSMKPNQYPYHK
jgi:hypothetical protein